MVFANPWESIFIPRGFAPWDENYSRGLAKTIASRLAITQYYKSGVFWDFYCDTKISLHELWNQLGFKMFSKGSLIHKLLGNLQYTNSKGGKIETFLQVGKCWKSSKTKFPKVHLFQQFHSWLTVIQNIVQFLNIKLLNTVFLLFDSVKVWFYWIYS